MNKAENSATGKNYVVACLFSVSAKNTKYIERRKNCGIYDGSTNHPMNPFIFCTFFPIFVDFHCTKSNSYGLMGLSW